MSKAKAPRPPAAIDYPPKSADTDLSDCFELKEEDNLGAKKSLNGAPCIVYVISFMAAIGGFLFGYHTGVMSGATLLLKQQISLNHAWQEVIVGCTVAIAALFSLFSGSLADCFGRRTMIKVSSLIFTVGTVIMATAQEKVALVVGRVVIGIAIGLSCAACPLYIAESSPSRLRGLMVSMNSVFITGGNFVANLMNGIFSDQSFTNGWRYVFALATIPSCVQLLAIHSLPESPLWLIEHGRFDDAREALKRIRRDAAEATHEYELIRKKRDSMEDLNYQKGKCMLWNMLTTPHLRCALIVGCALFVYQQLAGINAILYYSATIMQMAGIRSVGLSVWLATISSGVYLVCTLLVLTVVDKVGRRVLTLLSLTFSFMSLLIIAVGFQTMEDESPKTTVPQLMSTTLDRFQCSAATTCEQCIRSTHCGFCFEEESGNIVNASCLPVSPTSFRLSMAGACAEITSLRSPSIWAYEWCPSNHGWIAIFGLILYLLAFAPGMGTMPWIINTELYPTWSRSTGMATATSVNFIFNMLVTMPFLTVTDAIGKSGVMFTFAAFTLSGLVFFFLFLPETGNKHLEENDKISWRSLSGAKEERSDAKQTRPNFKYLKVKAFNRHFYDED